MRAYCLWLVWCIVLLFPTDGRALSPAEILVIANSNVAGSEALARYYMARRNIPATHLLMVEMTEAETCSRDAYDSQLAKAVRQRLQQHNPPGEIHCLVTMYGLPLKILPPSLTSQETEVVDGLRRDIAVLESQIAELSAENEEAAAGEEAGREGHETLLRQRLAALQERLRSYSRHDQRAALDSELALVLADDYSLSGWVPNPHFVGFKGQALPVDKSQVLMVSRLDGPTPEIVRRIIDVSVAVEEKGLKGIAYFDARWPRPAADKPVEGYALYDRSIHWAAERLKDAGRLPVVLDDQEALFQPGQAPDAALYCGWYSLAQYVDAFEWVRGAVGYHIASSECSTLKVPGSQVWCKRLLEEGVAATIGPTSEPYLQAFTVPEIFFGLLADGRLSLAECYALATPFLSWQMVLIGDPLYRPFGKR